jgi:origin recognition complex subunit 3
VIRDSSARILHDIVDFVSTSSGRMGAATTPLAKVPTALITTGAGSISHDGLFSLLAEAFAAQPLQVYISVSATDAPNLKTLLKNINQKGTRSVHDDDIDEDDAVPRVRTKGPKLLSYDLEILRRHVESANARTVVLAVRDSEAVDAGVLGDLFGLLQ